MDTIAELIFFIGIITTIYYVIRWIMDLLKNKKTKPYFKYALYSFIVALIFLTIGTVANPPKTTKNLSDTSSMSSTKKTKPISKPQNAKSISNSKCKNSIKVAKKDRSQRISSSKKSDESSISKAKVAVSKIAKPSSSKTKVKKYDFSKIKLGMSKSQVKRILGKPTEENSVTLYYGNDDLDFDHNAKLSDGSPKSIHSLSQKHWQKSAGESSKKKDDAFNLQSFANVFGRKDVETLQRFVGSAYSATETPQGMAYEWKTKYGMLYRLDVTSTGITHVYKGGLGDTGTELYVGQTIKQKVRVYHYGY